MGKMDENGSSVHDLAIFKLGKMMENMAHFWMKWSICDHCCQFIDDFLYLPRNNGDVQNISQLAMFTYKRVESLCHLFSGKTLPG